MDIKPWEYADFPAFNEPVPGATRVPTTGDEIGVTYHPDVPYATAGTTTLHLQILVPQTRNQTDATTYPCMVHVQGSAWMKQDRTALVPTLSRIAERGFVVAIVEDRHSGIASFPAQIQDARNAVRFMRANAAQYHVDADNLFLSGCSSGGQVALLARVAKDHHITLVHVSSDYVFDGTADLHSEDEAFAPLGVYGQTKAAGDIAVANAPEHYILRSSWVIGEGRNFVKTMMMLSDRVANPDDQLEQVTVVDDQYGRLTFTKVPSIPRSTCPRSRPPATRPPTGRKPSKHT